jgi:hypothetical protein
MPSTDINKVELSQLPRCFKSWAVSPVTKAYERLACSRRLPTEYLPWDQFAALAWMNCCCDEPRGTHLPPEQEWCEQEAWTHFASIADTKPPVYLLSKEIAQALKETPADVGLKDLPAMFPVACFFLPRRTVIWDNHGLPLEIYAISIVDWRIYSFKSPFRKMPSDLQNPYLTKMQEATDWLSPITMVGHCELLQNSPDGKNRRRSIAIPIEHTSSGLEVGWRENPVAKVGLGALLALAFNQVEVTDEVAPGTAMGFGKSSGPQPLPCRWIGKNFRIARESSPDRGGTHASPQAHWRRGHWHRVRHGQGKQEVKLNWYQPVFVTGAA